MTGWLDFVSKKCQTNIREIFVSGGPDKLEKTKKWILYFKILSPQGTKPRQSQQNKKICILYFVSHKDCTKALPSGVQITKYKI